jgi:hypothetical protein
MPEAAFFCPNFPFPPSSGIDRRCVDVVAGLRQLGYRTSILGSPFFDSKWALASAADLVATFADECHIHRPASWERVWRRGFHKLARLRGRNLDTEWISSLDTPPGLTHWFNRTLDRISPDVIVMVYARFAGLLARRHYARSRTIVDSTDLQTLNAKMWSVVSGQLPACPIDPLQVDRAVASTDFFEALSLAADSREFRAYDRFNVTIAISPEEEEIIHHNCKRTRTIHGPITVDPVECNNSWAGSAIFPAGPNPYNIQAYAFLAQSVLPLVLREVPDFVVRVTGAVSKKVLPVPGVELVGFVDDLSVEYCSSRLLVCPVFGGTGQQVKIVEAMAHGVPVVALARAARGSPIIHGVNGFVADSPTEFAQHIVRLWRDAGLRAGLGRAARDSVREGFSQRRLVDVLSQAVEPV